MEEKEIVEQYQQMLKRKNDEHAQVLKQNGYFHPDTLTLNSRLEDHNNVLRNYSSGMDKGIILKKMEKELNPIPENVRLSLEKNVGKILTQDQGIDPQDKLNDPNRFYATVQNRKGSY